MERTLKWARRRGVRAEVTGEGVQIKECVRENVSGRLDRRTGSRIHLGLTRYFSLEDLVHWRPSPVERPCPLGTWSSRNRPGPLETRSPRNLVHSRRGLKLYYSPPLCSRHLLRLFLLTVCVPVSVCVCVCMFSHAKTAVFLCAVWIECGAG